MKRWREREREREGVRQSKRRVDLPQNNNQLPHLLELDLARSWSSSDITNISICIKVRHMTENIGIENMLR